MSPPPTLLVFSHLRWGFVFQRPQHLLSRLAGRWRVIFVEEPVRTDGPARLVRQDVGPELTVLVPHTPVAAPGFHDDQIAVLQPMLSQYLATEGVEVDITWLYTPMALPLAKAVAGQCLVYDCMDELAAFLHAPRQLRQRESALLKDAALVLTGGPSLYEARRDRHPNVHCLPSAVDVAHFSPDHLRAGSPEAVRADELQAAWPRPRLGFFGVIDERLDLPMVAHLADERPDWTIAMVGPVVKIDPATLPQRPNIHWLGMQPYTMLPYLLAGWDLCLMPFAMNESTRSISPTKTLEYMAGEKPVVSTPVHDVVVLYGESVSIASTPNDFVAHCDDLLNESPAARCRRALDMLTTVSTVSWDRTATAVHQLLAAALAQQRGRTLETARSAQAPAVAVAGGL